MADRRRRLHRPVDRALAAARRPVAAGRRARARDGRLRCVGPQRRLVRRRLRRPAGAVEPAPAAEAPSTPWRGSCTAASTRSAPSSPRPASTAGSTRAAPLYFASTTRQLRRLDTPARRATSATGFGDAWHLPRRRRRPRPIVARARASAAGSFTPHAAARAPGPAGPGPRRRGRAARRDDPRGDRGARRSSDRLVRTDHGTVRADVVVRATEAYTAASRATSARSLPLGNYMVATEPIDDAIWAEIGLADRELFELTACCSATASAPPTAASSWGGLGGPDVVAQPHPAVADARRPDRRPPADGRSCALFPPLAGVGFTHDWGGVLGVPRDLLPGIGYDRATGFAWAGGYTGQGVAAANAAGARPRRPHHRRRQRPHPPALGRPPLPPLGARTPALPGRPGRRPRRPGRRRVRRPHAAQIVRRSPGRGFRPVTEPEVASGRNPKNPPPVTKVWPVGSLTGS